MIDIFRVTLWFLSAHHHFSWTKYPFPPALSRLSLPHWSYLLMKLIKNSFTQIIGDFFNNTVTYLRMENFSSCWFHQLSLLYREDAISNLHRAWRCHSPQLWLDSLRDESLPVRCCYGLSKLLVSTYGDESGDRTTHTSIQTSILPGPWDWLPNSDGQLAASASLNKWQELPCMAGTSYKTERSRLRDRISLLMLFIPL
jgi:hypothetical protein